VLFVVCQSITEAKDAAALLAGEHYLGDAENVLVVTSESPDADLAALAAVEGPDSPVRAVVSVDKLKEGWDVKNIAVIVALRALASDTLTEQILGRGLRLPFGRRVLNATIDQVDIVAHDSYAKLLSQKDSLLEKILPPAPKPAASKLSPTGPEQEKGASGELSEQNLGQGVLGLTNRARVSEGDSAAPSLLLMEHETALDQGMLMPAPRRAGRPATLGGSVPGGRSAAGHRLPGRRGRRPARERRVRCGPAARTTGRPLMQDCGMSPEQVLASTTSGATRSHRMARLPGSSWLICSTS